MGIAEVGRIILVDTPNATTDHEKREPPGTRYYPATENTPHARSSWAGFKLLADSYRFWRIARIIEKKRA
jgi:hypothetical protein